MKISKMVSDIPASPTLSITAKVGSLKAQGQDVIGLGAGEPDFDTPEHIKDAALQALKQGKTKYTPAGGTPELKEAICSRTKQDYGLDIKPDNVIISCGAKHSLFNLALTLFEPGDEVICICPYWVSYPPIIRIAGAVPVIIDTTTTHFKLHPDQVKEAITERTTGIIINSPSNPAGTVYGKDALEKIADICLENDISIISDDIYQKLVFGNVTFSSIATISPEVAEKTFIIHGVSKTYAMTGWRIGYCIGDSGVIKAITRLQSQSTSNPTSIAQAASVTALTSDQTPVETMRKAFEGRRKIIISKLKEIPGFEIIEPDGTFYCFPSIKGYMDRFDGAGALANFLLDNALVAVVPGEGFGSKEHIRVSFATSEDNIIKGLERIKQALA
ncbi:MAG: pyridoxal phosphate-dependent aminotransferase [Thermodesulfobacteriota bacterium]|nr:pyridoxal phosphate-dependent aminotransferase [Thermodesulfobacteriota bacterium]